MQRNAVVGFVVILATIVGGIIFYAAMKPAPAKAPGAAPPEIALPAGGYSEHTQYYDIAANYPTATPLAGGANGAAIARMQDFVIQTIGEFKSGETSDQGSKDTLQITYLIGSSARTLSYIFTIYEGTGGAHDNTFFHTFVFDTATGKDLSLADLFTPGAPYLDTLSRISRAKLPDVIGRDMADPSAIEGGTTPDAKNFQDFFFDNQDFVILFPPYQVASYAAGPQTLRIPLSELSGILKPEYR